MLLYGEPHHAIRIYYDAGSCEYVIRVWSRSKSKGSATNQLELEALLGAVFENTVPCLGVVGRDMEGRRNKDTNLVPTDYPVKRLVAPDCEMLYSVGSKPTAAEVQGIGMCSACMEKCETKVEASDDVAEKISIFETKKRILEMQDEMFIEDDAEANFEEEFDVPADDADEDYEEKPPRRRPFRKARLKRKRKSFRESADLRCTQCGKRFEVCNGWSLNASCFSYTARFSI